jgi:hypothetical protein
MVKEFFESCVQPLVRRSWLFSALNLFFFGGIIVGALLVQVQGVVVYELPTSESIVSVGDHPLILVAAIFVFNLVVSGFFLTTVSGLILFVMPFGILALRALLWGTMIALLPSPQFFVVLPTFVLEGEAYVIAALAGVVLGMSWLKPSWVYRGERLSRLEAFRSARQEFKRLYFLVVVLLLAAAIVETITIVYALIG